MLLNEDVDAFAALDVASTASNGVVDATDVGGAIEGSAEMSDAGIFGEEDPEAGADAAETLEELPFTLTLMLGLCVGLTCIAI